MAIVLPVPSWAAQIYRFARKNAAQRSIPFDLTRPQFDALVRLSEDRCMVTGIPFEFERHAGSTRRPFAPSLDRIDSAKGYTAKNCRLVCILINLALNEWGMEPLLRAARNLVVREREIREQELTGKRWQAAGYATVREYLAAQNIVPESSMVSQTTHRARVYCHTGDIEYIDVERYTARQRKDGSHIVGTFPAFPLAVLDLLIPH